MVYTYNNFPITEDLAAFQTEVLASTMTNKSLEYCRWDEDLPGAAKGAIQIVFTLELTLEDKAILDQIVSTHQC